MRRADTRASERAFHEWHFEKSPLLRQLPSARNKPLVRGQRSALASSVKTSIFIMELSRLELLELDARVAQKLAGVRRTPEESVKSTEQRPSEEEDIEANDAAFLEKEAGIKLAAQKVDLLRQVANFFCPKLKPFRGEIAEWNEVPRKDLITAALMWVTSVALRGSSKEIHLTATVIISTYLIRNMASAGIARFCQLHFEEKPAG